MFREFIKKIIKILYKVEVENHAEFKSDRLLIVSNHQSFLDGLLVGIFLPIKPTFVVHTSVLSNCLFRFALSFVDYLAVDTSKPMAMKKLAELIKIGKPIVIFPEGRITTTGNLMKVYDGSGFIAFKTDAEIVPIYIDGAVYTKFSRKHKHPRKLFSPVKISIGKEQKIDFFDEILSAKDKPRPSGRGDSPHQQLLIEVN